METGNIQSCSNLNEKSKICDMAPCIESVKCLLNNSASNTDTWIVTFKDGVKYDILPIKKCFVKLWLSRGSIDKLKQTDLFENLDTDFLKDLINRHLIGIESLNYEAKVYRDIVKELINSNICPNFIRFLGLSQNCSFTSVSEMLVGLPLRNTSFHKTAISLIKIQKRAQITGDLTDYKEDGNIIRLKNEEQFPFSQIKNNTTYTLLVNESIKDGTLKFKNFIDTNKLFSHLDEPNKLTWSLIFQLIAAIYAMSLSRLNHNDLHLNNAYVEQCKEKDVSYVYGGETFNFKTRYVVKVFDFDRSYSERLGDNRLLERECEKNSQCNKYIPNLDAIKVMGSICSRLTKDGFQANILNKICAPVDRTLIAGTKNTPQSLLKYVWNHGNFLIDPETGKALEEKYYSYFSSTFHILKECAKLAGINSSSKENTYVCNPSMFDNDGKIKVGNTLDNEKRIVELELENKKLQEIGLKENMHNLDNEKRIVELELENKRLQATALRENRHNSKLLTLIKSLKG